MDDAAGVGGLLWHPVHGDQRQERPQRRAGANREIHGKSECSCVNKKRNN